VTRLACALACTRRAMTVQEAAARFEADTHLAGPAALSEASARPSTRPTAATPGGSWRSWRCATGPRRPGGDFTLKRFHTAARWTSRLAAARLIAAA